MAEPDATSEALIQLPHAGSVETPRVRRDPCETAPDHAATQARDGSKMVGDTGFEPVTSSVSRKRATAAPIARGGDGI